MDETYMKDFFAGLAMLGLLISEDLGLDPFDISSTAYQLAEAMMEARYDSKYRKEMEVNGEY